VIAQIFCQFFLHQILSSVFDLTKKKKKIRIKAVLSL